MTNIVAMTFAWFIGASPIKSDETVVFFPTAAHYNPEREVWIGRIHGWIFEAEDGDPLRKPLLDKLEEAAQLDGADVDRELLRQRAALFLVDNERGKEIEIRLAEQVIGCQESSANGHFFADVRVPRSETASPGVTLEFEAVLGDDDERRFSGRMHLVAPEGISVISDIDDTIKVSDVRNKVELLRNTFGRPFQPAPGMSDLYKQLAEGDAAFHYVSASPWQLYGPLEAFRVKEEFPAGTYDMKLFRAWDESWQNLLANSAAIKRPAIERLLQAFPERRFLLIGDSGESDPEIYGGMAREGGEQIMGVAIRSVVPGETRDDDRFQAAFDGLSRERWLLFSDPVEAERQIETWIGAN